MTDDRLERRVRRRRRLRRHGRRAYIRSVYVLPSMATLGNAVCGFAAAYVAAMPAGFRVDSVASFLAEHRFTASAYLIFLAMIFDVLDGRLARFARHTTDFGGQLDSMADVISFGVAPALLGILLFGTEYAAAGRLPPPALSRLIWAIGALFMCCAAVRLARFNVSNEHGEQHHFSFLGLPSPAAGGMVAAWVLMQQDLSRWAAGQPAAAGLIQFCSTALPVRPARPGPGVRTVDGQPGPLPAPGQPLPPRAAVDRPADRHPHARPGDHRRPPVRDRVGHGELRAPGRDVVRGPALAGQGGLGSRP